MNYDCQWEDGPCDITWSEMARRLDELNNREALLLLGTDARRDEVGNAVVGFKALLESLDSHVYSTFCKQITASNLLNTWQGEIAAFEEEMKVILPPSPGLYLSQHASSSQFRIHNLIEEFILVLEQSLETSLLQFPYLDWFGGSRNREDWFEFFIPSTAALVNDFAIMKKRVAFLLECRKRLEDYLRQLYHGLKESLLGCLQNHNTALFKQKRESFHQRSRFYAMITAIQQHFLIPFLEVALLETLPQEVLPVFDSLLYTYEAEGKLTLSKLAVDLTAYIRQFTLQQVLKHWTLTLQHFHHLFQVNELSEEVLLQEHAAFRKTRYTCYLRYGAFKLQHTLLTELFDTFDTITLSERKRKEMNEYQLKLQLQEYNQKKTLAIQALKERLRQVNNVETWEFDFWSSSWCKFHNVPAFDSNPFSKTSSTISTTTDYQVSISTSNSLEEGEIVDEAVIVE